MEATPGRRLVDRGRKKGMKTCPYCVGLLTEYGWAGTADTCPKCQLVWHKGKRYVRNRDDQWAVEREIWKPLPEGVLLVKNEEKVEKFT